MGGGGGGGSGGHGLPPTPRPKVHYYDLFLLSNSFFACMDQLLLYIQVVKEFYPLSIVGTKIIISMKIKVCCTACSVSV